MIKIAENRMLQVILAPIVSETEQVVFRVSTDATKAEIKAAVELLFKVKVDAVNVVNVKGKSKRFGRTNGRRKDWKKAYVSLVSGQELDLTAAQ